MCILCRSRPSTTYQHTKASRIIRNFQEFSEMNLFKKEGSGLLKATTMNLALYSQRLSIASNKASQWFEIVDSTRRAPSTSNKRVPEMSIKKYYPLTLLSSKLDTFVSRSYKFPFLVGGVTGSQALQQLDFCVVSTKHECSKAIASNCIFENVEYRFRVNGPVEGYLNIDGDVLKVMSSSKEASGLNLYKKAGWGLRVAHVRGDFMSVLATNGAGAVLTMEKFKENDARQWFQIVEGKKAEKPYRRF
ncbi:hypothetical protein BGZ70_003561 [Mortierella alpina]|uniref:Uncharacterized protein n=1 Tax=Mortierella alpina TaxID=64518 RepID=A0A9P6ITX3_MORAP|nr:hypothetical protein BGZ70_003561 [Mortierella alpina]